VASALYVQRDQPTGVPPLALTGERTLPDVPAENYWFRRHLAVYEWIAARVEGMRVVDMACGEGYGSDVLARSAGSVVGVDANPDAHEHARLRYRRANLRFERALVETFHEPADAVVFLQTIEHLRDPGAALAHFRSLVGAGRPEGLGRSGGPGRGTVYVSTPNVLTLAPHGAARSDNPWHVHEYRAEEFHALCHAHFSAVALYGLYHARKLRLHELALRAGWDALHPRLGLTERFYGRFTPAIASSDFVLRTAAAARMGRVLDFLAVCRP
jgi:2-polyprenyl-3-methyl-5-hydroxy-6-metoxy-1,4-benzoquinol methylase